MVLSRSNGFHDDPHAVPGLPVLLLPLLPVVVSDPVAVLLLKLVHVNVVFLGELRPEELHRILQSETNSLEEETVLKPGLVLDVVGRGQHVLHGVHTEREVPLAQTINLIGIHSSHCLVSRVIFTSVPREDKIRRFVDEME